MLHEALQNLISSSTNPGRSESGRRTEVRMDTLFEKISCKRSIVLNAVPASIFELLDISAGRTMTMAAGKMPEISFHKSTGGNNMEVKLNDQVKSSLEDLSLPLQVVVGEVRMSVRDILDLEAGLSCKVEFPEDSLVKVYLGGECIADAELAMDENNFKLKILAVHLQHEEQSGDNSMNAVTACAVEQ